MCKVLANILRPLSVLFGGYKKVVIPALEGQIYNFVDLHYTADAVTARYSLLNSSGNLVVVDTGDFTPSEGNIEHDSIPIVPNDGSTVVGNIIVFFKNPTYIDIDRYNGDTGTDHWNYHWEA